MEEINIREIEMFLAVVKNQNISRTAEKLYISQSALSSWISRMEEYCGVKLFRRTNRGVVLTPEGEALYARLDIAYKRFQVSVEDICGTFKTDRRNDIKIGCLSRQETMERMNEVIADYSRRGPGKKIHGERFNFHELRDGLLCDELDLAVTLSSDLADCPEFETKVLGPYPLFFIAAKGTKDPAELNGKTLIVEQATSRKWAEKICLEHGIRPGSIRYVNSYILLETLAASGEGFAVDGKMIIQDHYAPKVDLIPAGSSNDVQVVLAWKKQED